MRKQVIKALLLMFASSLSVYAEAPNLLTYQGRLKEGGQAVSGNRAVEVRVCDDSLAGTCHTTGSQSVTVSNGLFRSTFTVPVAANFGTGDWYLEIWVAGTQLLPRERLTSNAYSLFSATAAYATNIAAATGSDGVYISSNLYVNAGGKYYGDGSQLTNLPVSGGAVSKTGDTMSGQLTLAGSTLTIAGDAFSVGGSTLVITNGKVGIGTESPLQPLQVAGDINVEIGYGLRINNTAPSGQFLRGDGTRFSSSLIVAAELPGTIVRTTETITTTLPLSGGGNLSANRTFSLGGLNSLGTANYVVGVNAAAGAWEYKDIVGVADETDVTHGVNSITVGLANPVIVTKGGTGLAALAQGDLVYGSAANTIAALAKDTNATRYLSNTGAGNAPAWGQVELTNGVSGILPAASGGTGAATLTGVLKGNAAGAFSAMTGTAGTLAKWSDANTIAASVVRDDGADVGVGVAPTTGIKLDVNGKLRTTTFQMTSGGNNNYVLASDASGNASWVNPAAGGLGDGWVGNEITNAANTTLTRSGLGTSGNPYLIALNLGNTNTWTAAQTFSGGLTGTLTGNADTATSASAVSNTIAAGESAITAVNSATVGTINWARVNKTGSNLSDLTTKAHGSLTAIGVNTHTQIDTHLGLAGTAHGATSANTASQIVARDASSNFSAGTITANLTGNVTGAVSGNADTVTNGIYTTTNLVGDVTGTPSATVVGNDSHTHGSGSLTGGVSATYSVVVDTFPYTCSDLTFTNGILTAVGAGVCP